MLTVVSRILLPALVTGLIAALISASNASPVVPAACNKITARWSSVWIFMPDCPPSAAPRPAPSSPAQAPNPAAPEPPH
ncbi:hypothetical protein [Mycobacterium colombiense]|uniref:Secreted protein n=1 Tax=Mycobacterium colombiense TaxID=339268 RepID=A0A1A2Z8M3_9MYCO|nr:hypothetical protein [Mycobacterium colombiense]OBI46974.1 hypothetical protein A5708_12035 [Mycobacterium colombiense]